MRGSFIIIFLLIGFVFESAAYVFDESIVVDGTGSIDSKTNAMGARDSVKATGTQTYTRNISDEGLNAEKIAKFSSKYTLNDEGTRTNHNYFRSFKIKSNSGNNSSSSDGWTKSSEYIPLNRYVVAMSSAFDIQHNLVFSGINSLESNNSISYNQGKINTKYRNKGAGRFKETIVNFNSETKPTFIADTEVNASSFAQQSGFGDTQILGSDIDKLIQWARNEPAIPGSIASNPKIDLKRGIIGRSEPSVNQQSSNQQSGTQSTTISPDATSHTTPAPAGNDSNSTEGHHANSLNDSSSGMGMNSRTNLTTESVPNGTQQSGNQPTSISADVIPHTTGAPLGNDSNSTEGHHANSLNDSSSGMGMNSRTNLTTKSVPNGTQQSDTQPPSISADAIPHTTGAPLGNDSNPTEGGHAKPVNGAIAGPSGSVASSKIGLVGDVYPAASSILIAPFENKPIPTAILGRVAKFDLLNPLLTDSIFDVMNGKKYKVFDRNGIRTVEYTNCESEVCQNYKHISYAKRWGDPIPLVSPMVNLDELTTPTIP